MGNGSRILVVAAAVLTATTWLAAGRAQAPTSGAATSPAPPGPSAEYLGSAACESCHQDAYARWKASLHIQMTRPVAEATILGDFSPAATLTAHGRSYVFGTRQGKPFVTMRAAGRAPETHHVDYTLGSKRFQGYLSTLPDGRMYVLPVFWHVEAKRWLD